MVERASVDAFDFADEVSEMKVFSIAGALALALGVAACGGAETTAQNKQEASSAGAPSDAPMNGAPSGGAEQSVHSGEGNVTAVDGDQVSISHGPIESLGWPAMTMTFRAESPQLLQGIAVGDPVAFQFRQSGGASVLTSISKR